MTEPAFDELLRRLVSADVDFVVVGGLAVGAWGVVRGTKDEELRSRAKETEILGIPVAVCSLEDLKAMKRAAGRTRDLADLEDLEAAS